MNVIESILMVLLTVSGIILSIYSFSIGNIAIGVIFGIASLICIITDILMIKDYFL